MRVRVFATKGAYLAGAAVVIAAALWASGFPPREWLAQLHPDEPAISRDAPTQDDRTRAQSSPQASSLSVPDNPYSLPGTDASASPSPLPLYLVGVVPGRNVTEGTAHIGTSIENPQTYAAGATLSNGARLAEIHSDHVVLTKGERSVRLDLYKRDQPLQQQPSPDELLNVGGNEEPLLAQPRHREVLTDYLRPSPLYDGDALRGYQLYPGKKAHVFSRMGLHAGDVITAIDGVPLTDPEHAIQMLRDLTAGAALHVTIERGGRREQATLDGAVILADLEQIQTLGRSTTAEQPSI